MTRVTKARKSTAALLAGTFLVYLASFHGAFTYDDVGQILANPKIWNPSGLKDVIFCGLRQNRVLLNLMFAACYQIGGGQTWPFHLANMALHLLNGWLLLRFLLRIFPAEGERLRPLPWIATGLFLLHPLQVQSVSYISGNVSLVQCAFYLACLNLHAAGRSNRFKVAALIGFSVLAKETGALIPLMLAAYDLTLGGKRIRELDARSYAIYGLGSLMLVPMALVLGLRSHNAVVGLDLFPAWEYVATQFHYLTFHLRLLIDSSGQSIFHHYPEFSTGVAAQAVLGFGLIACGALLAKRMRGSNPAISFFFLSYVIVLAPTSFFLQVVNPFAEYRLYQPNISFFVLAGALVEWIMNRAKSRALLAVLGSIAALYLVGFNLLLQRTFKDEITLYSYALDQYPSDHQIHMMLGGAFESRGRPDLAEPLYKNAERLLNTSHLPWAKHPSDLLISLYFNTERTDLAFAKLEEILAGKVRHKIRPYHYRMLLEVHSQRKNRVDFEKARTEALTRFPGENFPEWPHGPTTENK